MKFVVSLEKPYRWATLNAKSKVVDSGTAEEGNLESLVPNGTTSIVAVAPAEQVTLRSVNLPIKRRASLEEALPYALEDTLSEDVDDLHFSIIDWVPGGEAVVSILNRDTLEHWLDEFGEHRAKVSAVIPEQQLLPFHPESDITIARTEKNRILLREGKDKGVVLDNSAFRYWWDSIADKSAVVAVNDRELARGLMDNGGENINFWEIGRTMPAWLSAGGGAALVARSVLTGEYEPEHLKPKAAGLYWGVAIAFGALCLLAAANVFEYYKLKTAYADNQAEIEDLFTETFPDQEYLGEPKRQIQSLLSISADGDNDDEFQYLLEVATAAVKAQKATLEEVNFRETALQIGVQVNDFSLLDKLTAEINETTGITAEIIASDSDDSDIRGQIKMMITGG